MVGIERLLQLTLWVAAVQAFFPWFPDDCAETGECKGPGSSKRGVDGQTLDEDIAGFIGFEVVHKGPVPDEDASARAARAARTARRLAAKYAPLRASRTSQIEPGLRARANEYSVIEPAVPTSSSTAGIYQDGTDFSYFIKALYGSSAKPAYMLLDSGAGTSWVMGSDCTSAACEMHNTFGGAKDSTSFTLTDKTFDISYGSGSVSGVVGNDIVQLAGMKANMSFGIASTTSQDFVHFPFDGILGLSMSKGGTDNFMAVLKSDKILASNLFAITISRSTEVTNTGAITFGSIDPARFTGDISYTNVASSAGGDWAVPMDDMGFDGKGIGIKGRLAYIDTGTSFVFGPPSDVAAIHKLIPGASSKDGVTYEVPCDINKPITISFSGVSYAVSPKDWVSGSGDKCTSNFYGHEVVKGSWLLGDVFLKNVYSVFDADAVRIGFANKPVAQEVTETTTTTSSTTTTASDGKGTTVSNPTITSSPAGPSPVPPAVGFSGQGTESTAGGTAVAETGASASATPASPGEQLEKNKYVSILCIVAVIAMVA
ncbi:aspartic peptidase domain-containing protein [Apodospora peruviana]|uniref:Aspartic peptidase domain-containing protein n=1 Tax=Apodospora peruviana TaxID=516989 RepID=A0AAE0HYQ4_9PEZI|nr:aspartic peptidase domain-containing protein [Apodospora peruviana]